MPGSAAAQRHNLRDSVAQVIRDRILSGVLRPGQRIDQDGLAEELNLSKLPVREALIRLEWLGLVRTIPHRGSFVVELDPEDLLDTYRVYGTVCAMAAEAAVGKLSPADIDHLERLLDAIDAGPEAADIDAAHMEFHRCINRAGASRRMRRIIGQLLDSLPVSTFDFTHLWIEGAQQEHRAMVSLLRDGDAENLAIATCQHFCAGGERVVEALRARGYWAEPGPEDPARARAGAAPA